MSMQTGSFNVTQLREPGVYPGGRFLGTADDDAARDAIRLSRKQGKTVIAVEDDVNGRINFFAV
jgi:hypothetical protein